MIVKRSDRANNRLASAIDDDIRCGEYGLYINLPSLSPHDDIHHGLGELVDLIRDQLRDEINMGIRE